MHDRPAAFHWFDPMLFLKLGLVVLCTGGAADIAYHLLPAAPAAPVQILFGPQGSHAHVLTLIGMVAVLAGVIHLGVRHGR